MQKYLLIFFLAFLQTSYSQWEEVNNGLSDMYITGLATVGNTIFAATMNAGVYISTDFGENWSFRNNGLPNLGIRALAASGNYIYAGTCSNIASHNDSAAGVFYSTDLGENWKLLIGNDSLSIYSIAADGSKVVTASSHGIYISTNYGDTWILSKKFGDALAISNDDIYTGDYNGLFYSNNYGESWDKFDGLKDLIITSILKVQDNIYVGVAYDRFSTMYWGGLYISRDNGKSWEYNFRYFDSTGSVSTIIKTDNKLFIGNNGGVYFSADGCKNWIRKKYGDMNTGWTVVKLAVCGKYIFAGTWDQGVYRALLDDFTSVEDSYYSGEVSIYPNPASSYAIIRLEWPDIPDVRIEVTNLLGYKVKEITSPSNNAEMVFNLDLLDIAQGTYFVTVKSGHRSVTKQIVVIK